MSARGPARKRPYSGPHPASKEGTAGLRARLAARAPTGQSVFDDWRRSVILIQGRRAAPATWDELPPERRRAWEAHAASLRIGQ